MNIKNVLQELDALLQTNQPEQVIHYLTTALQQAEQEGDTFSSLSILNELMGFTREICQYDASLQYAKMALQLLKEQKLTNTVAYATTLLNTANALRAAGHLQDSLAVFQQAEEQYQKHLSPNDMLFANLYNNKSLLYQELELFEKAAHNLEKALHVVLCHEDQKWELAVTYSNLANTYLRIQNLDSAIPLDTIQEYAQKALDLFAQMQIKDTHYAAALTGYAQCMEQKNDYQKAIDCYKQAANAIEQTLGKTEYYYRVMEYYDHAKQLLNTTKPNATSAASQSAQSHPTGMVLCQSYYETYGAPLLTSHYAKFLPEITVGLVGEGSDCFQYDDSLSKDHDWGPRFCIWLEDETYEKIGEQLAQEYAQLPTSFQGEQRMLTKYGKNRCGVLKTSAFYTYFLGAKAYHEWKSTGQISDDTMLSIPEYALAAVVNGTIFQTGNTSFIQLRNYLQGYYTKQVQLQKLAQACSLFSQHAQYNYPRMKQRNDIVAASFALQESLKQALAIGYLLNGRYTPHDKWLWHGAQTFTNVPKLAQQVKEIVTLAATECLSENGKIETLLETLAYDLLLEMKKQGYIGNLHYLHIKNISGETLDTYLEHYANAMLLSAHCQTLSKQALIDKIVLLEWNAFDNVQNEGGRAGCQDDWDTFSIMRASQYQTWKKEMLQQYYIDFQDAYDNGWNMITEKYARMEESTAPDKWELLKEKMPVILPQKKAIMEEIIRIQVQWMETFANQYPNLAQYARILHTSEDTAWNTSYETYLRGELATYSDKMLELYGRFIVNKVAAGENLAFEIMEKTVACYGYASLEDAAGKI